MSSQQIVTMHPRHWRALADGIKRSTVRWNEDIRPGPTLFVFDPPDQPPMQGKVVAVEQHCAISLKAEEVHQPAGTDMRHFVEELRANYYPQMPDDAVLQVVTFTLELGQAQPVAPRCHNHERNTG